MSRIPLKTDCPSKSYTSCNWHCGFLIERQVEGRSCPNLPSPFHKQIVPSEFSMARFDAISRPRSIFRGELALAVSFKKNCSVLFTYHFLQTSQILTNPSSNCFLYNGTFFFRWLRSTEKLPNKCPPKKGSLLSVTPPPNLIHCCTYLNNTVDGRNPAPPGMYPKP